MIAAPTERSSFRHGVASSSSFSCSSCSSSMLSASRHRKGPVHRPHACAKSRLPPCLLSLSVPQSSRNDHAYARGRGDPHRIDPFRGAGGEGPPRGRNVSKKLYRAIAVRDGDDDRITVSRVTPRRDAALREPAALADLEIDVISVGRRNSRKQVVSMFRLVTKMSEKPVFVGNSRDLEIFRFFALNPTSVPPSSDHSLKSLKRVSLRRVLSKSELDAESRPDDC